jgi:magnesium chelatase family protein
VPVVSTATGLPPACDDDVIPGPAGARRALEVAAAGGHHLLLVGAPGSGKTLLASRLPRLLPPPTFDEARETAATWSAAGILDPDHHDPNRRPFRAPHHTVSFAGLLGGGNPTRPGEASLAHHGVLFLDDLPEFNTGALDIVRHAARTGEASICRSEGTVPMPAKFQLVAAANPCPCGYHGDAARVCRCRPAAIQHYAARLRFPVGDIFDIRVRVRPINGQLFHGATPRCAAARKRVAAARGRQEDRASRLGLGARTNAALTESDVQRMQSSGGNVRRLADVLVGGGATPTAALRILRVALTLADLDGVDEVRERDIAEAAELADPDGPGPGLGPWPQALDSAFDPQEEER